MENRLWKERVVQAKISPPESSLAKLEQVGPPPPLFPFKPHTFSDSVVSSHHSLGRLL